MYGIRWNEKEIPLLLAMGELQLALRTASGSNDSDLMMFVALSLYDAWAFRWNSME